MIHAIAGVLSGILASMGLGGGFVLLVWLTLRNGMPQREAQGVNLLFFLPIALISVIMHIRAGIIDKKLVLSLIPGGIIGSVLGTVASSMISNDLLRKIYAVFLLIFGLRELFGKVPHNPKSSSKCEKAESEGPEH